MLRDNELMSTKGCKRDPYTPTEYSSIPYNEWSGGWVRNSSTAELEYYNSSHNKTSTIAKGQPSNPYTDYEYRYKLYQEMNWTGGWVEYLSHSIRYIDASNIAQSMYELGENENPYYYVEYHNKFVQNNWTGGWVEYESGGKAYINAQGEVGQDPAASGSGCGSGCGSGEGFLEGAYVSAGSKTLTLQDPRAIFEAVISWTSGNINALNNPSILSAEITLKSASVNVFYPWIDANWIGVYGSVNIVAGYSWGPENDPHPGTLGTTFTI